MVSGPPPQMEGNLPHPVCWCWSVCVCERERERETHTHTHPVSQQTLIRTQRICVPVRTASPGGEALLVSNALISFSFFPFLLFEIVDVPRSNYYTNWFQDKVPGHRRSAI